MSSTVTKKQRDTRLTSIKWRAGIAQTYPELTARGLNTQTHILNAYDLFTGNKLFDTPEVVAYFGDFRHKTVWGEIGRLIFRYPDKESAAAVLEIILQIAREKWPASKAVKHLKSIRGAADKRTPDKIEAICQNVYTLLNAQYLPPEEMQKVMEALLENFSNYLKREQ